MGEIERFTKTWPKDPKARIAFKAGRQCGKTNTSLGLTPGTLENPLPLDLSEPSGLPPEIVRAIERTARGSEKPVLVMAGDGSGDYYWESEAPTGRQHDQERGTTVGTCPSCQRVMLMPPGRDRCAPCQTQGVIDQLDAKSFADIEAEKARLDRWREGESRMERYKQERSGNRNPGPRRASR